ncbi:MAG: glutamate-5-semialdehyde dehydrogenase [Solobacterium sp.]|nr:glutamate-5-semialdehyde dehydrogenase [Solobacterium sp.]
MITTNELMKRAKKESLNPLPTEEQRNEALLAMADALLEHTDDILRANEIDCEASKDTLSPVMMDRLLLTSDRIVAMADGVRALVALPDPVGKTISSRTLDNGLIVSRVQAPMGVIAIIYESRPNVTSDAAALALKAGSVAVLRSGRNAWESANQIVLAMKEGLKNAGLSEDRILLVEDKSHESSIELMHGKGYIDLLIPRGGAGLIKACVEEATVPCIETGTGICHVYVDESADQEMALRIVENAKTSRPSVCNAEEVLLVHQSLLSEFLPKLKDRLSQGEHPVELRLDERCAAVIKGTPASATDFDTEFLDYILAVKAVNSVDEAIAHINAHGTHHSDAIITSNDVHAKRFTDTVDSACVYVNASTRFTDGGEFGLGCEMGISTQKLHARGPMGLEELCTYKYVISGNGQIR